jgi:hypothetical protein
MRAQDFIKKRPTRTLSIFDIDDTLLHTTAKIKVVKDGKVLRTLTNQEFNTYELQPGEEFDFGEFRNAEKFRKESEPIEHMMDELKTILDHTQGTVIMLTARADFDDKDTFLKTFRDHGIDMSRIHVHRAGNLPGDAIPAEKKAVWVRRYLDTGKYNQVSLYDDSMSNLRVFKSLKQEYPDVDFDAYYITPDDVTAVEGRGKKRRRKSKYVYGAPWGWYGMNTGYSGDGGGDGGGMEETRKLKRYRWSSHSRFSNLEDNETNEASYPGNIGAMEVFKFMKMASQDQIKMLKKLIDEKEYKIAWALIQKVTGVKLQGKEFQEDRTADVVFDTGEKKKVRYHPTSRDIVDVIVNYYLKQGLKVIKVDDEEIEWDDFVIENFADGRDPGRKGLAKRMGVPTKASVSSLRKIAKSSSGEKQRMAHWMANMKAGRNKSK